MAAAAAAEAEVAVGCEGGASARPALVVPGGVGRLEAEEAAGSVDGAARRPAAVEPAGVPAVRETVAAPGGSAPLRP